MNNLENKVEFLTSELLQLQKRVDYLENNINKVTNVNVKKTSHIDSNNPIIVDKRCKVYKRTPDDMKNYTNIDTDDLSIKSDSTKNLEAKQIANKKMNSTMLPYKVGRFIVSTTKIKNKKTSRKKTGSTPKKPSKKTSMKKTDSTPKKPYKVGRFTVLP